MKRAAIDPGKEGGFAIYDGQDLVCGLRLKKFSLPALYKELSGCHEIIIERAQAAPKQGISTSFEYGRNFGKVEAVAILTGARIFYVAPQWWKGRMNLTSDKKLSLKKARELYPNHPSLRFEGDDGVAEAIIMGQILLDAKLFTELETNNEAREKKQTKKRVSYRL